jgi:hypothetical protein
MKKLIVLLAIVSAGCFAKVTAPYEYSNGAPKYDLGTVYGYNTANNTSFATPSYTIAIKYNGVTYNLLCK